MGENSYSGSGGRQAYLRRQAMQLAGQLPDDREDALAIVENMKRLVEGYLHQGTESGPDGRKFSRLHVVKPAEPPE